MYPTISDLLFDLFGFRIPLPIQSFGFMMAVAFLFAAWILSRELKRKEKAGILKASIKTVMIGKPAGVSELVSSGITGFILGWKVLEMIFHYNDFVADPQSFLLSMRGNIWGGIAAAALMMYFKYREKEKQKLPHPQSKQVEVWPHQLIGDITVIAAITGLLGAKIFDNLEHWDSFIADPVGSLLSFSGLTFYGGLIFGAIGVLYFCYRNKIPLLHAVDAAAPALILAYGIGRIGCQLAGDGDWGIYNSAYAADRDGSVVMTDSSQFSKSLEEHKFYFVSQFGNIEDVPHAAFRGPDFLPDWLFATTYPHNVIEEGIPVVGCSGRFCNMLPVPVFPTPLYETTACLLIFLFLMWMRKKITAPGFLFSLYLLLNGMERLLVEQIRVNALYQWGNFTFTQAELIAVIMMLAGMAGMFYFRRKGKLPATTM